jgi:hypothetical protein
MSRRARELGLGFTVVVAGVLTAASRCNADDQRTTTVGMPARIDQLVLPGPELEVRPLDDRRQPVVLRITEVFPHGSALRYDLVYYGLDPGEFDLKDFLRRKDGTATDDLPSIKVTVQPVLPTGQVLPNKLELRRSPRLGGYRTLAIAAGFVWVVGLLAILLAGRRGRSAAGANGRAPASLAERLRPMVEAAMAGRITEAERAELERMLFAFWRRRLNLDAARPAEAIAALREHADSAPLVRQLEAWLHQPGAAADVDLAKLLEPYRSLPPDQEAR